MLQQLWGVNDERPIGAVDALGWTLALLVVAAGTGCGPVEPEPLDNKPPFIGEVSPQQAVREVQGKNLTVQLKGLKLYDQNREESLHVAWFGSNPPPGPRNRRFINRTTVDRIQQTTLQKGTYYVYEEASEEIEYCGPSQEETSGRETIWMYVSDRPFASLGDDVEPSRGGFLVSHAWVVDYLCL